MRNVNLSVRPYVRPQIPSFWPTSDLYRPILGVLSLHLGLFLGSGPQFGSFWGLLAWVLVILG